VKFGEVKENYYETTGKASDVARHLAFVGFGVVWLFRVGTSGISVPVEIAPAAIVFAVALFFDAMQYGVAARKWKRQVDVADSTCDADDDNCDVPTNINAVPRVFFGAKLWSVGIGYAWLIGAMIYLGAAGRLQSETAPVSPGHSVNVQIGEPVAP